MKFRWRPSSPGDRPWWRRALSALRVLSRDVARASESSVRASRGLAALHPPLIEVVDDPASGRAPNNWHIVPTHEVHVSSPECPCAPRLRDQVPRDGHVWVHNSITEPPR